MSHDKAFQITPSGIKFPKNKSHLIGIIKPDTHTAPRGDVEGGKSQAAWSCFLQAIGIIKPDFIVDIGDAGEWTSVNKFVWDKKKRPPMRYTCDELEEEASYIQKDFEDLENVLPRNCQKFFIQGNHDQWVDNFTAEIPELRKTFNISQLLKLNKFGWKYFPHGKWVKFGKIYLNHGTDAKGVNHLRNMVLRHGANIMYGHVHDMGSIAIGSLGGTHKAFSVGCLANMDKPFLRGSMTNWEHGFCTLDLKVNGNFQVQQIPIYAGECLVYGQVVKSKGNNNVKR